MIDNQFVLTYIVIHINKKQFLKVFKSNFTEKQLFVF